MNTCAVLLHNRIRLVVLALTALLLLLPAGVVSAQTSTQIGVRSATISGELQPDGSLRVTESIQYSMGNTERFGFVRRLLIPEKGSITITDVRRDGLEEDFAVTQAGQTKRVVLGRRSIPLTGRHQYEISYTVSGVLRQGENGDVRLYWPVVARTSGEARNLQFRLRGDVAFTNASCRIGGEDLGCPVDRIDRGVQATISRLPAGNAVVIRANTPDDLAAGVVSFSPASSRWQSLLVGGMMLALLGGLLLYWWRRRHATTSDADLATSERIDSLE